MEEYRRKKKQGWIIKLDLEKATIEQIGTS